MQRLANLFIVVAPAVLAQDLEELVKAEAHYPIGWHPPGSVHQLHNPDVDVSVDRPWYSVLAATDYLDILLQTSAIGRTDDVLSLQALL